MRSLWFVALLAFAALGGCQKDKGTGGTTGSAAAEPQLPVMTPDEVEKALAAKEVVAVDCNGDRTRKKYGVLPGAILTSEEDFPASELPADTSTKLVFYCADPG